MDDFKKLINNSLLKKVAIVGGTMGIREIVEFVDLKCPCLEEYNVVYAWCSMLIPALVFFLVGLLPMRRMCGYSRYFASNYGETEGETTDLPFSSLSFSCEKGKRPECCYNLCSYLDTALVAPITWIIAVHLQGDLFICANATQNYTSLPCKDPEKEILNENQKNFLSESKARSQMLGWIFMAGAIAFFVLSVFCNRCVDRNIVINKKYMDAAYDALHDEFYKCKIKKAISNLKKKKKKKKRSVEAETSDLPAHPTSLGMKIELESAETEILPWGQERHFKPFSGYSCAKKATSDLPALPLSFGDEDSEDTDEEWNNIVELYKRS